MKVEILIRGIVSAVFGGSFAWLVFSRFDIEVGSESTDSDRQRYLPYVPGGLLPLFLLVIGVIGIFAYGISGAAQFTLSMCFSIFLHISVYYILLILTIPFFRKHISARACAMLWVIPNYLYITSQSYMELPEPKVVLYASEKIVWLLFFVWLMGFVIVMSVKTIEHLKFRRKVLKDAFEVVDSDILTIWNKVIEQANIRKPKFCLMKSPNVKAPLSIGLFQKSMKVVLPKQDYSSEELELIFRHEIIHIAREDSWSKYFLVFCTAMCWFNPLMWIAMRKSAEDIELSCDETLLLNTEEDTRKNYASLLLDVAGDERGFTTCLSASEKAMHYRLKNIVKPRKRYSGALVVGVVFFVLCMSSGYVALAYGDQSGAELIYQNEDYHDFSLYSVSMADDEYHRSYEIIDEEGFHNYLSNLRLSELTGNYSFSNEDIQFNYIMNTPEGTMVVNLYDNVIRISRLYEDNLKSEHYYIKEGVDWGYINDIIVDHPALNLYLTREGEDYGEDFSAQLDQLWKTVDGYKKLVFDSEYPEEEPYGLFGYDPFDKVTLSFSKELYKPCSVFIESWDRSESYTVVQKDLSKPFTFQLPEYAAHYTIYAVFKEQNESIYEAEFKFDIGDI